MRNIKHKQVKEVGKQLMAFLFVFFFFLNSCWAKQAIKAYFEIQPTMAFQYPHLTSEIKSVASFFHFDDCKQAVFQKIFTTENGLQIPIVKIWITLLSVLTLSIFFRYTTEKFNKRCYDDLLKVSTIPIHIKNCLFTI
ncbi:MAG: hypothetical protein KKE39_06660 [Bacteroidetes bacterium]|nr:hypothetical protein [Bacteroidota bacterium]MBU1371961.1 hypothetical protein [Bacteroidota bacterium]MBU1483563.1 hypothetical protein [Bacteroidota bacterium]MBU1759294.1 hypothetical protein [Bacteroidota bacterium]MBU2269485.1 hypothetical protein [Bacteroidota bacterium]